VILTDQDNHDTLGNIVGKDFNKKELSLWDDVWMTPEREDNEKPSRQGLAAESD